MSAPTSFTQYCDDVRREADGRVSLMGVYPNSAVVDLDGHSKLPKVCAYTVLTLPLEEPLESISVVSAWNNKEIERVEIPDNVIAEFNQKQEQEQNKRQRLTLATVIEIRDLEIGNGGAFRTRVLVNKSQIEARTLRIQPRQDASTPEE